MSDYFTAFSASVLATVPVATTGTDVLGSATEVSLWFTGTVSLDLATLEAAAGTATGSSGSAAAVQTGTGEAAAATGSTSVTAAESGASASAASATATASTSESASSNAISSSSGARRVGESGTRRGVIWGGLVTGTVFGAAVFL